MTILENVDLRPYNTFNIQAYARFFTVLRTTDDVRELLASDLFHQTRYLILGGGSNVLFTEDFDGLVAKVELKGISVVHEDDESTSLHVGAGENWHGFVMHCMKNNLGGVENLSLIPGTSGAAPMQNIGAYGVEIKDVIASVEAIEISTGQAITFSNDTCEFGYRESIFKQRAKDKYVITAINVRLSNRDHKLNISYGAIKDTLKAMNVTDPTIKDVSDAVIHIRRTKLPDPTVLGNAGSFFKNPSITMSLFEAIKKENPSIPSYPAVDGLIKIPAGWLIEQCGWKGKTIDHIGVHAHQALVIVNYGGGKGKEIWALAMQIRDSVTKKFNITLHPEVNVIM
ncbi:MAG TPA: UDP-N-acetylmuramate dehydrogenase [Chryseolinea sp.]|nr:UDP-N-acetylmuramate dehydrogenase [Chryseolinea sp.]